MQSVNVTEQLHAIQRMLQPTSEMSDTLSKNACLYWQNQDKLLDSMHTLANGWFERRHAGTHAALEAAQRMCKVETPVELLREYQDWASGAFRRLVADGLACQKQYIATVSAVSPPLAPLGNEKQNEASQAGSRETARTRAA